MLKKDNFIIGLISAVVIFFVLYSLVNLFTDFSYFSQSRDSLWVYMVSIIPNIILSRFMLVSWNMEKTGKGMMFISLLGVLLVMYFVLK
ncbi:MAG: hypothetical protein IKU01_01440 [Bacteroidales bacterium]|nr:hypothetical protein [Bacteroidales bacterium]